MNYDEYDRWWNHEMSQRKGKGLRLAKLKTTSKQKVWGLIKKIQSMTPNDFLASSHPFPGFPGSPPPPPPNFRRKTVSNEKTILGGTNKDIVCGYRMAPPHYSAGDISVFVEFDYFEDYFQGKKHKCISYIILRLRNFGNDTLNHLMDVERIMMKTSLRLSSIGPRKWVIYPMESVSFINWTEDPFEEVKG